ncbi:hypothetical protein DL93DRAFT_1665653 [Clavulina sp. PMI_390]|nr:hypothetical protein DL93DRAFT_1665653 [Clavulina sp. PMI_390]
MISISSLPIELLSSIFIRVCQGLCSCELAAPSHYDDLQLLKALLTLSSVSSLWRYVALSTPRLWAVIRVSVSDDGLGAEENTEMVQLRLERSRAAPLTLIFKATLLSTETDVRQLWSLVLPNLPRCETLFIMNMPPTFLPIIFPLPGKLESLRRLGIQVPRYARAHFGMINELFSGAQDVVAPSFVRLEMMGLPCVPHSFQRMSHLRLRIIHPIPNSNPFSSIIRPWLEWNPTLHTLVLLAPPSTVMREAAASDIPIFLPRLKHLALRVGTWDWPRMIHVPKVQHIIISSLRCINSISPERFPRIERLSLCGLWADAYFPQPLPCFPHVHSLEIHACARTFPFFQLITGADTGSGVFPRLRTITLYGSGYLELAEHDIVELISELLVARPNFTVLCDTETLKRSPKWRDWENLPPLFAGRVHQALDSNLPIWVGQRNF